MTNNPLEQNAPINHGNKTWKRYLPHAVAGIALFSLIVVSSLFWMEVRKSFPRLPAGGFVGNIDGKLFGSDEPLIKFYVEKSSSNEDLFFIFFQKQWPAQTITPIITESDANTATTVMPLTLIGRDTKLQFTGSVIKTDSPNAPLQYEGDVINLTNRTKGQWTLTAISQEQQQHIVDSKQEQEVELWMLLKAELRDTNSRIAESENDLRKRQVDIDNLTNVVMEGEKLRAKANEKFSAVSSELKKVRAVYNERSEEARKLESSFKVSTRVTSMGKLTALSHESLEREWRWIDSMLRSHPDSNSEELDAAYERGQQILKLKQEISSEKERIEQLRAKQQVDATNETNREEQQ